MRLLRDSGLATFFTATYAAIHAFLSTHGHNKAALAVKKAAADTVILKDDVEMKHAPLEELVKTWQDSQHPVA